MKIAFCVLLSILLLSTSCGMLKTNKLMKQGELEQKNFKVEIPFKRHLGLIIIQSKVNGKEYDFILDTGAPNVITTEVAKELNLTQSAQTKASDSQGKKNELGFLLIENIEIGGLNFKNTGAAIADFSASPTLSCFKSAGLIGANLMRNAIWQFDFEKNIITLASSRDSLNIPKNAFKLSFETESSGTPKVDLMIGKLKDENVTLDLGSNGGYTTTEEMYHQLSKESQLISSVKANGSASAGLFGSGDGHEFLSKVSSFSMDSAKFENQLLSFRTANKKLLGTEFFQNFNLTIDWFTKEIFLVQTSELVSLDYKGFGFATAFRENKLFVDYLFEAESIKNSGLELGDQLLKIGDINVENITIESYCDVIPKIKEWNNKTESISIEILKKNGDRKSLVLKKVTI